MAGLMDFLFGSNEPILQAQRAAQRTVDPLAEQIRNYQGFGNVQPIDMGAYGGAQAMGNLFGQAGSAASQAFGAANMFDVQGQAQGIANQLNQLAQPQEQAAASQLANRLFSSGQLGATGGAMQLGQLAQAQEQAQTSRNLQALQQAQGQQQQLVNQAMGLSNLAGGLFGQGYQQELARRGQDIGIQNALYGGLQQAAQLQAQPSLYALQKAQNSPGLFQALGGIGQMIGGLGMAGVFGPTPTQIAQAGQTAYGAGVPSIYGYSPQNPYYNLGMR